VQGISYWTKNYTTAHDVSDPGALLRRYAYHDPIRTLPPAGQEWWRARTREPELAATPA
jgi:lysine 2,3-aminomutase